MDKRLFLIVTFSLLAAACTQEPSSGITLQEKVYVAVEGANQIAVLDPMQRTVVKTIDLSEKQGNIIHEFSPHNVQVAPDGMSVWVTGNHGHSDHGDGKVNMRSFRLIPRVYACHSADEESVGHGNSSGAIEPCTEDEAPDEVIIINPKTDAIIHRIPLAIGAHLAHVVLTPDSSTAYVTAQMKGVIYKINARSFEIEKEISAPKDSEPHGLRIAPDGSSAYIALLKGHGFGVLNLKTETLQIHPLNGSAVQAGVTPDGKVAFASVFDGKSLAIYHPATKSIEYMQMPKNSHGPLQMYPTPDSRYVYLADQGYYFNQPNGNTVYKIDLEERRLVKEISVGTAPHGVVVSPDGTFVYVTNLLSNDVSIIDTSSDVEIGRVSVGKMPNGISIWSQKHGGTP